ncbi:hypothetical protein CLV54_2238 [Compostimonas suwonensis]|uniref:DoxX-like protein n=2 Tax=Compostimonas suwonensis TaxID=1048394 RepID=A0A2M9BWX0_9MICO|nr:hypothetical protein CLV54_2238 [Compostimonas suwonensis]
MVLGLMIVAPIVSVVSEFSAGGGTGDLLLLAGKWFVFWAVGVRLLTAGLSQILRPGFTASSILGTNPDRSVFQIVQELGFANLGVGLIGILSLPLSGWIVPAAVAGGLFLGLSGIRHIAKPGKNTKEWIATLSDLVVFLVLLAFVLYVWISGAS